MKYSDDKTIHIITPNRSNPKRWGTKAFVAFELLKISPTVGEFRRHFAAEPSLATRNATAELDWCINHSYITLR